jgi:HEAT repeat protein
MTSAADCIALELDNDSEVIRRSATKAIVTLEPHAGSEAAKAVASMLSNSSDTTKRAAALCLAELGKHTAPHGKALAVLLESEDVGVRNASVRALVAGGRGMASSMSTLMKKLDHPNEDVRRAAVAALRGLAAQCSKFTKTAHKLIEEEPSVRHHCQALDILGGSETYALPHLSDIVLGLEDKEWKVRRAAIDALEDLGPHAGKAGGEVARRLLHDNPDTRRAAAEALGRMGQHAGDFARRVEGLVETEKDEDVKRSCESAVARLNAMDLKLGKVPVSTTTGSPVKTKTKAEARSERKAASKPEKAKTEKKPADKSEATT